MLLALRLAVLCVLWLVNISTAITEPKLPDPFSSMPAKYVVGLSPQGIENEDIDDSDVDKHVLMTDKAGSQYNCRIPAASHLNQETKRNKETKAANGQASVAEILDTLSARCFYRLEDWWTYELCYGKHVRQFHREKDAVSAEYSLGQYAADQDKLDMDQVLPSADAGHGNGKYVQQAYVHGDDCDITGQTRQTEVRYSCVEGSQEVVLSIKEPSTCHYVMAVGVPALCQHLSFGLQNEAVQHIVCTPATQSRPQSGTAQYGDQTEV